MKFVGVPRITCKDFDYVSLDFHVGRTLEILGFNVTVTSPNTYVLLHNYDVYVFTWIPRFPYFPFTQNPETSIIRISIRSPYTRMSYIYRSRGSITLDCIALNKNPFYNSNNIYVRTYNRRISFQLSQQNRSPWTGTGDNT